MSGLAGKARIALGLPAEDRWLLGEAVAQTLLLGLDPYPRSPAAEAALRDAGVKSEEEARAESSPFAALAALKGKLEG